MDWMREMESIVRDVEALFDTNQKDTQKTLQQPPQRRTSADPQHHRGHGEAGLVLGDHSVRIRSPPPRALTQYLSISGANATGKGGLATEETTARDSIYLPSNIGLRSDPPKEPLSDGRKQGGRSAASAGSLGRQDGGRGMGRGHIPISSTSSNSDAGRYFPTSNSVTRPATHPEALPLSPQELLESPSDSIHASLNTVSGSSVADGNDRHAYLRRFGAHSGTPSLSNDRGLESNTNTSANHTLSQYRPTVTPPSLTPHQPSPGYDTEDAGGKWKVDNISHVVKPSITVITSSPSKLQRNLNSDSGIQHQTQSRSLVDYTQAESTSNDHSATSISATRSSRSSARSSLALWNLPFSLPLSSTISSTLRSSPSLGGTGSPTTTSTDGSEVGDAGYSPALEAIEDFEGEEDTFGDDDARQYFLSYFSSLTRHFPFYFLFFLVVLIGLDAGNVAGITMPSRVDSRRLDRADMKAWYLSTPIG
jgi:hypothetical protein